MSAGSGGEDAMRKFVLIQSYVSDGDDVGLPVVVENVVGEIEEQGVSGGH
jgi:hypothetical protein